VIKPQILDFNIEKSYEVKPEAPYLFVEEYLMAGALLNLNKMDI